MLIIKTKSKPDINKFLKSVVNLNKNVTNSFFSYSNSERSGHITFATFFSKKKQLE